MTTYPGCRARRSLMSNNVRTYSSMISLRSLVEGDILYRMRLDIEKIRKNMSEAKEKELVFYGNLNLSQEAKKTIFHVDALVQRQTPKIVVWDPVQGNLIMTEQEYKHNYKI